jgi:hypothetical protein
MGAFANAASRRRCRKVPRSVSLSDEIRHSKRRRRVRSGHRDPGVTINLRPSHHSRRRWRCRWRRCWRHWKSKNPHRNRQRVSARRRPAGLRSCRASGRVDARPRRFHIQNRTVRARIDVPKRRDALRRRSSSRLRPRPRHVRRPSHLYGVSARVGRCFDCSDSIARLPYRVVAWPRRNLIHIEESNCSRRNPIASNTGKKPRL